PAASAPSESKAPASPLARPADLPPLLPAPGLAVLSRDEQGVLNELAPLWGWQAPTGGAADLCQAMRTQGIHCFRTSRGTLAQLAQLDRPAMLVLRPEQGPPLYARLVSINARRVVLAAGALHYSLPVEMLAILWRGEFTTLWRAPEVANGLMTDGIAGPTVFMQLNRLQGMSEPRLQADPVER
ncbi:MAG: hypothetical protein CFE45_36090, partial [Burkholderiales bacterium PBB5]